MAISPGSLAVMAFCLSAVSLKFAWSCLVSQGQIVLLNRCFLPRIDSVLSLLVVR